MFIDIMLDTVVVNCPGSFFNTMYSCWKLLWVIVVDIVKDMAVNDCVSFI